MDNRHDDESFQSYRQVEQFIDLWLKSTTDKQSQYQPTV